MIFHLTLLSAVLGCSVAMNGNSPLGRDLLSKSRHLEQGEDAYSWVVNYSLRFDSCHTITQYGFGEDGNQNENGAVWKQNLIKFKLCDSSKCRTGCKGGEYLVPMADFVDAYTEERMNSRELACENVRENCACNGDDDGCEDNCYTAAGMEYCIEAEGDDAEEEFNIQEWMECKEIEDQNGGYYNQQYFVGLKCSSNNQRVNLGVFMDEFCTQEGPNEMYAKFYGTSLPYAYESIVEENCVSCAEANGDDGDAEISEFCNDQYVVAAKCESKLNMYNPQEGGCDFMDNLYLREDGFKPSAHKAAVALAWIFFLTTVGLGGMAFAMFLNTDKKINLNDPSGGAVV
jgi:hypothetical protein